ncbi:MAG: hypothetical protein FJX20_19205 [Alphaproteobacteria bacterium]|nr:hypothetical protein [Alphaproteobacteria bacterium]
MSDSDPEHFSRLGVAVVRASPAPAISDQSAHARLHALLEVARNDLADFCVEPIVVAASPNRFNDIYWFNWRAIRLGTFFTEHHDSCAPFNYERDLQAGPEKARQARKVLDRLESQHWRDLFADSFSLAWHDQVLALVQQDGLHWLVFAGSNLSEENHVFALGNWPITYIGECIDRFDWEMQQSPPLRFQLLED